MAHPVASSSLITVTMPESVTLASSSSSSELQLVSKPNTTSPWWKHFALECDEQGHYKSKDIVICLLCSKGVIAKGGNTSNLKSHLRIHHPLHYAEIQKNVPDEKDKASSKPIDKGQPTITSALVTVKKYDHSSKKWRELTDSVTYFLAKDMLPVCTVEKESFQKLVRTFDPQYQLPSQKYFSNTAMSALYTSTRDKVSDSISATKHYAATTDLWPSVTSTSSYMSYTVHFIDQEWNLKSWCLQTLFIPQDHDANGLTDIMVETLDNWGLDPRNQVCITTDNINSIVCTTSESLNWNCLGCFGYNLHLAVVNSLEDKQVVRALGVCHKLVELFANSCKKKCELSEAQLQLDLPNHSLVSDSDSWWGSKEKMVARVLEQEKAIQQVIGTDHKTSHLTPTQQDMDVLQSVHSAIKDLAEFTDMLSGEDRVTLSALKAVLYLLKNQVLVESTTDTTLTKDIKKHILTALDEKYSESKALELINLASFLDPRFITDYIEESELPSVIDKLIDESSSTEDQDRFESTDTEELTEIDKTENANISELSTSGNSSKRRKLSSWLKSAKQTSLPRAGSYRGKVKREIETFQRLPRTDEEADPLKWWSVHASTYPILAAVAKKYLCIPASSSASFKRISSTLVSKQRELLKPHRVDQLVFLAQNL